MHLLRFFVPALTLFLAAVSSARAELIEYSSGGSIIGSVGPTPLFLTPIEDAPQPGGYCTFVFDGAAGPIETTAYSATYAGLYGLAYLNGTGVRPLYDVTLTVSRNNPTYPTYPTYPMYEYTISGVTAEGWKVVHYSYSLYPDFTPSLALPTVSPTVSPDDPYQTEDGYFYVYGPEDPNGYVPPIDGARVAWIAYSDMEGYFDTRILTLANRATGGTASASKQKLPNEGAAQAFDGSKYTKWFASGVKTAWLQCQPAWWRWTVVRYDITSADDVPNRDPKDWQLLGSQDGITWVTLDTRTGESFSARHQTKQYSITNIIPYQYYRLNITATRGAGGGIQLAELALIGY